MEKKNSFANHDCEIDFVSGTLIPHFPLILQPYSTL